MQTNRFSGQKALAASQNIIEKNYWLRQLSGFSHDLTNSHFPYDFKYISPKNRGTQMDSFTFKFPAQLGESLIRVSSGIDHMLHMVLVAAIGFLLKKYTGTGSEDFIVAAPIYKENTRNHTGFINTVLLLRQRIHPNITFRELLKQVKQTVTEAVTNKNYPVEILADQLNFPFSPEDDFPLAGIFILLENIHHRKYIHHIRTGMIFSFSRKSGVIDGGVEYRSAQWRSSTIERIINHLTILLQKVLSDVDLKFSDIEILSGEEKNQLLFEFNNTETGYPSDRTIHQLFEEQVEKTRDHIAIVGPSAPAGAIARAINQSPLHQITYHQLNQKSNRLTHLLRKKGVQPDTIIGLMLEPSMEMIIAMLAIVKAGGSYLPISPHYPANRINSMLQDSHASILITREELIKDLSFISLQSFEKSPPGFFVSLRRPQVEDLDSLQIPDRSSIDYEKYSPYIGQSTAKNSITLQFTRGCVFNCAFCFKVWPDKYVVRSAENIFQEIQLYYKMGIRRFAFVDDLPNLNVKESSKLFNLIIKSGMKVHLHFPNGIRGDILSKEYIDLMVEAGTVTMDLALETTSPRLQKLVRKNLNLKKLEENIKYIAERYPHVILETQILHGIPSETREEARASLDFIKRIRWIHFPYIHILNIYPQSDMAEIAVQHGISRKDIENSADLAYHELPGTLPFPKSFTRQYQSEFLNEYFLSRERLSDVLPYQMKVLTEDELVQKYNSYLPVEINSFSRFLEYVGIDRNRLDAEFLPADYGAVPDFNRKLAAYFMPLREEPGSGAMRILLLDLTQYFTHDTGIMYDVVEPPLGLMYVLTHLNKTFGSKINGKIAKSRIDFDSFDELKSLVNDFQPDVIGIRALNFYKDFFHKITALLRQWGTEAPIIAGGPYATSNYRTMLQDKHIDLAVLGEGEITFTEVIEKILENNKKLPHEDILKKIPGIVFIEKKEKPIQKRYNRDVFMVDQLQDRLPLEPVKNPEPVNTPGDLAYIIYTSGSTGIPKGVMVRHNNLVNQIGGLAKTFGFDRSYHYILLAAFTFDVSMMHIFLPLTTGAKLFLIPEATRKDPTKLWQFIYKKRIDILNIVPAFMKAILENIEKKKFYFKYLFVGGDIFDIELYTALKETFNTKRIINIYGPTETTINATLYPCLDSELKNRETIPIGKPLKNYNVYILDNELNPVPLGAVGELCISGAGVARGYLNRPELTAEKFCLRRPGGRFLKKLPPWTPRKNFSLFLPYSPHSPIYRTGDLARWLPDGNIEFLGRIDQQVKIRGFRIEPGEIEKRLLAHGGVTEAVVMAKEDKAGDKCLCAYIVLAREIEVSVLRDYLANQLPDYMVPAYFVRIEKIPLTPNGKVDKQALPKPETRAKGMHAAPRDEIEKTLVELWAEVLGIEKEAIGIDGNFFEMGGHSLKATILISKIHKKLQVRIPLVELFRTPNVRGLSRYIKRAAVDKYSAVRVAEEKEYHALSSAQKRLYLLQQMDLESITYNMPAAMTLTGDIKKEKLEKTFLELVKRHESFRTSFHMVKTEPAQRIHNHVEFELEYHGMKKVKVEVEEEQSPDSEGTRGLAPLPKESAAAFISSFIRSFDLSQSSLLRIGILHTPACSHPSQEENREDKYILMIDMHHIISDGISISILINEFMALYQGKPLPELRIQYKDYSEWQNSAKQGATIKKQKDFWLNQFNDEKPILNLPVDYPRPTVQSFKGSAVNFEIGTEETKALKILAMEGEASLFMVLLSIYYILLWKLSGQEDIVIGTPTAGRQHADFQQVIGMFVNTLALHHQLNCRHTFKELLYFVKGNTFKAFENQEYQFEDLVEELGVNRDTGRNPLFDVMFALQNVDIPEVEIPGLTLAPHELENPISKFDMDLAAVEVERHLQFTLEYCTGLFKEETVQRFICYFKNILAGILRNPTQRIADIDFIPKEEKRQILFNFNDTATKYPKDKTIHQLFQEQVELTPDNIAVVGEAQSIERNKERHAPCFMRCALTYRVLNEKSNQLAHLLIEKGVLPDTIVGIMVERSLEMIIGILGILKAGGAYLPIDPQYPEERITYMLKDSSAKILLKENDITPESFGIWNLGFGISPSGGQLAYIIYTSGTTGRPKGVMVEHRSVIRLVKNTNYVKFESRQRILPTGALEFDASTFEIWGALLNGLTLLLVGNEIILEVKQLKEVIKKYDINTMWLTSPLFNQTLDSDIEVFAGLQQLLVGGDALSYTHINQLIARFPGLKVINGYGPTENTTFSTTYRIDREYTEDIPIGKPISNSTAYIVDQTNHLVPVGVGGELVVSGDGVARGYLNNPELTNKKFLQGSRGRFFQKESPGRRRLKMYKTGDLASWLPDGNIQFLGRMDLQVKIRGFRLELGEIENELLHRQEIQEAVVVVRRGKNNEKFLCAYVVFQPSHSTGFTGLKTYLSRTLPHYMIPSYFVSIDKIPLTANGKIDHNALPKPNTSRSDLQSTYVAPQNELENKIAGLWEEVLGLDRVGTCDNFFELGGNSLKVVQLKTKLEEVLNIDVPVAALFEHVTITAFVYHLSGTGAEKDESLLKNQFDRLEEINRGKQTRTTQRNKRKREIPNA